jgi:hypothetical protein|tara:strand:- start:918 stop:1343 length:426 start_codon:yes stop_codon:yes gene_type:complete
MKAFGDWKQMMKYIDTNVQSINNSKIFAGLMIITLNIASRFVNLKVSKTMESFLKYTFSKYILIFAIAWMGTRDIYIALIILSLFVVILECFLDEESSLCILPEGFKESIKVEAEENEVSEDDIKKAKETLEKAEKQKSKK